MKLSTPPIILRYLAPFLLKDVLQNEKKMLIHSWHTRITINCTLLYP